jgi:hypothetical protein
LSAFFKKPPKPAADTQPGEGGAVPASSPKKKPGREAVSPEGACWRPARWPCSVLSGPTRAACADESWFGDLFRAFTVPENAIMAPIFRAPRVPAAVVDEAMAAQNASVSVAAMLASRRRVRGAPSSASKRPRKKFLHFHVSGAAWRARLC